MLTLALPPPPPDGIKNIYIKRIHYLEYALIKYINYHYNFIFICLTLSVTVSRHLIHISNQQTKTQSYCCSTSSLVVKFHGINSQNLFVQIQRRTLPTLLFPGLKLLTEKQQYIIF